MIPRLNWGVVALIVFVFSIWLLTSMAVEAFAETPLNPFVGLARVCIATPGEPQACATELTRAIYNTEAQCADNMNARLGDYVDRVKAQHPDWTVEAQFMCVQNTNAYRA